MRFIALAALLLTSAADAKPAQKPVPPLVVSGGAPLPNSLPNLDAVLAMMDKMFPALPDPDPARLALARRAVTVMWPDGSYGKMMTGMMGGMFNRALQLKNSDLAAMGTPAKQSTVAANADLSLHDQAVAKDPYFDQRMAAMRDVLNEEASKASLIIDPHMRDGLAHAMARRFDARQLTDIDAFFATPSGRALAGQYMQLWVDPDTLRSLFQSMPEMIKLMPDIMAKMKAANDKFPAPPKTPTTARP
ncbi:MAG TPA: hypothetical protein VFW35_06020 [Sphingomicrobium sp.]|nr:hypothetical protein [Sphingomicrobium sp.]